MRNTHWAKAVKQSPDPERAKHWLEVLLPTSAGPWLAKAGEEQCRILAALFSGSQAACEALQHHPEWFTEALAVELLAHPCRERAMRREVDAWLEPLLAGHDYAQALERIRGFKQREMIRIAARDLARLSHTLEITRELSDVADVCLGAVCRVCHRQLSERLGQPFHRPAEEGPWQPTAFCVLGLGKLGGQELNYSSDVDVIFVYEEEGSLFKTPPEKNAKESKGLTSHQFFIRLAESFAAEVGRTTAVGQLYRIDLRLRPEGKAGPLARSLESYENFYAQWGQTWERMMLIKARCVAGDSGLAFEFGEMAQSFRYPRSISPRFLDEMAAMKQRIEDEVVREGELDRNVKLGRGGIREIEFIAQMNQLLHAGRQPFLQGSQTLPTLSQMVQYHLLPERDARDLSEAYTFLRDVEHRLQMDQNRQTHSIPADPEKQLRLARLMGFKTLRQFNETLRRHTNRVRELYDRQFAAAHAGSPLPETHLPPSFEGSEPAWQELLTQCCFREPDTAFKRITEFIRGPGYIHVSTRTEELGRGLLPRLFKLCPRKDAQGRILNLEPNTLSDPDRVLARLDSFIAAYGSRATLFELWTHNASLFDLLVLLFDRSEFLAETAIRTPDMVDDLMISGHLRRSKTAAQTLEDLRHGRGDKDQHVWLRRYHEVEFMRIGLRDILGLADFEHNLAELSALAEACLQYALEAVLVRHRLKQAPFAIIGLGKLGGNELTYGSDLDVVFVAPAKTKNLQSAQKLAAEVLDLLSKQTEHGIVFRTDARLRPDGEKGLLVNTLPAYEAYYRRRAQLWEIQSLTRARPVAGDPQTGQSFFTLAKVLTHFSQPSLPLAAFTPQWKTAIAKMRLRIEKERTPAGKDALAIKTGGGGLMDAEFIAQTLSLEHGFQQANTLTALELVRTQGLLPREAATQLIENYCKLRRVEGILRRWSYEGETELPDDPAPYYRVSVRCGFATPDEFRQAIATYRQRIRSVYRQVFPE